jgi:hypothetical protein
MCGGAIQGAGSTPPLVAKTGTIHRMNQIFVAPKLELAYIALHLFKVLLRQGVNGYIKGC